MMMPVDIIEIGEVHGVSVHISAFMLLGSFWPFSTLVHVGPADGRRGLRTEYMSSAAMYIGLEYSTGEKCYKQTDGSERTFRCFDPFLKIQSIFVLHLGDPT